MLFEVEVAKPLGGDQGVRVDDDGQDADEGEDDEEGGGDQGDCALHQTAVGGEIRVKGDGSEESENEGEESIDPVLVVLIIPPFQFDDDRQCKQECKESYDSKKWDAVVADEGEDEGEGDETEENVGEEVN